MVGRRKILFLVTALEDRGAENAALRLARGMERTGTFSPSLLALKEGSGRLRARADAEGVARPDSLRRTSVWSLPGTVRAVRDVVLAQRIDVLYSFLFHPNMVARIAGRLAGTCLVVNGERSVPGPGGSARSVARRWTARLPDGYTAVSDAVRNAMIAVLGVPPERVRTIRNGVEAERIPENGSVLSAPGRVRLISVGSLSPEKSLETAVDALRDLVDMPASLTILGDGPRREALESRIRAAGLAGRALLPGHVPDIVPALLASDIYIQSSVREGLSNALLSAMAAGLPCVATDVGGTREAVVDGETGLLVPPGDPRSIAGAVRRLAARPDEARRMGRNGRLRVLRDFTAERELSETVGWLDELLQRRSAGTSPATSRT